MRTSPIGTDEERIVINKKPYEISIFHSGQHKGLVKIEKKNGRFRYKFEPILWFKKEDLLKQYCKAS
jgi:hypothetical protein